MRVLLFEQWDGGHYANYLNCLVPEVASLGCEIVLAINAKMRASPAAVERWQSLPNVTFMPSLPEVGPALRAVDRFEATRNLLACLRAVRPDFALVPSADAQTLGLAAVQALGGAMRERFGPIEGTVHYGYGFAAATRKERFKEQVYSRSYQHAPYAALNLVNFAYYEYAQARRLLPPERLRMVGDPVPQPTRIGRAAARRLLGLDPNGRYVGLFGALDRRKAVPELLAAFRASALGSSVRLVLGGRLDPEYAKLLDEQYGDLVRNGSIAVMDRFLSDAELECAYQALDLAIIPYYRFPGLASLALKAVAAGTPLIVNDYGWMKALIRRFDVGRATDILNVGRFADCLRDSLADNLDRPQHEGVRRLLAFHETSNFLARMTSGLRRAAGAPAQADLSWEWVLDALPAERRLLT